MRYTGVLSTSWLTVWLHRWSVNLGMSYTHSFWRVRIYIRCVAGKSCLLQLVAVQQAKPGPVIPVQQAKSWKEHQSKENKTKLGNVQQPQAQPRIRSSVDYEADHTSGQHLIMHTTTKNVIKHHMIITWLLSKRTSILRNTDELMSFYSNKSMGNSWKFQNKSSSFRIWKSDWN